MNVLEVIRHIATRLHSFYVEGWQDVLWSLVIAIGVVATVLFIELLFVPWQNSSLRRLLAFNPTVRTDALAFLLVETNISLFVGMAMFFGVTYVLQRQLAAIGAMVSPVHIITPWLSVLTFYILIDLANYWTHRLCHRVPILWHIHRYHHSAPEMTILTAARDHPMERALSSMITAIPAAMVALPAESFLVVMLLAKAIGLIKHSNLQSNWGWFGRYFIQSPAAHRIHHSIDPVHYNKNFSSLFQFWDVLFATAYHPKTADAANIKIGVEGDDGQSPAFNYLVNVFVEFARRLFGGRG